jgi:hypothetical protein
MRTAIYTILFFIALDISAQNKKISRQKKELATDAQMAFDKEDYGTAWKLYRELLKIDNTNSTAGVNCAMSMVYLNYPSDSSVYLAENLNSSSLPEAKFYLAGIRHKERKFSDAIKLLEEYAAIPSKKRPNSDEEINYLLSQCRNAQKFTSEPRASYIKNMGENINSVYPDYVPVIIPDESALFFTSKRSSDLHPEKNADNSNFEDVYVSYKENGKWKRAENIGFPINSETNDGCVAVSPDGQRMIIYRTAADKLTGDLYITQLSKNNRWLPLQRLGNEINSEYVETSACFSMDTSEIYFSSNRPGGLGGKDLYRIKKLPNGTWGKPYNLGPNVNTKYDDDAPFLHPDGITLYFSSRGHNTMGGYDIFKSTMNREQEFEGAENVGYPINDVGDDIFFVLSVDGQRGYYSSIKKETFGDLDIYQVDTRFKEQDLVVKLGYAKLDNNNDRVKITLIDKETNEVNGNYFSNPDNGKFILVTNPFKFYKVIAEADGYSTQEFDLAPLVMDKNDQLLTINLKKE